MIFFHFDIIVSLLLTISLFTTEKKEEKEGRRKKEEDVNLSDSVREGEGICLPREGRGGHCVR